jgi:hypothetical protein
MWVASYLSGLNWYNMRDFLEGKEIGDIVDAFGQYCTANPTETVRNAAVNVVAKFRKDILIFEEQHKQKK